MEMFNAIFYLSLTVVLAFQAQCLFRKHDSSPLALIGIVIFLIVLWSVISPGGYDFDVYQRWTDTFLTSSFREILIYFKPPEYFLLPWLYISAFLGVSFTYLYAFSVVLLVAGLFLCVVKQERKKFLLLMIILLASPAAPFLLGNVIRQGYASLLIVALPFLDLKSTWRKWLAYGIMPGLLHRSAVLILAWFTTPRWKWAIIGLGVPVLLYTFMSFQSELLILFSLARDYHGLDTELSPARTIMRSAFFSWPFLATWASLRQTERGRAWLNTAGFLCVIIGVAMLISLKAADRFTYYLSPLAVGSLYYMKSHRRILLVGIMLAFMTLGLMVLGGYDKHFSHEYYGVGIDDSLSPE
jgi:hypothetical protein